MFFLQSPTMFSLPKFEKNFISVLKKLFLVAEGGLVKMLSSNNCLKQVQYIPLLWRWMFFNVKCVLSISQSCLLTMYDIFDVIYIVYMTLHTQESNCNKKTSSGALNADSGMPFSLDTKTDTCMCWQVLYDVLKSSKKSIN